MNRYYLYCIMCNLLTCFILYIPNVLIEQRFDGALMSMILGIPISFCLAGTFLLVMRRVPRMDLASYLRTLLPRWVFLPFTVYQALMWFAASCGAIGELTLVLRRYTVPDISFTMLLLLHLAAIAWAASRSTKTVLAILEIVSLLCVPLMTFLVLKAWANERISWDSIYVLTDYVVQPPTWMGLAASTYVFSGYVNLAVFHKVFRHPIGWRSLLASVVMGTGVLFTIVLVPVGFFGTYGVADFPYISASTADSMRLDYGFIERVLYLYMLCMLLSMLNFGMMIWHVGIEMLKTCMPARLLRTNVREQLFALSVCLLLSIATLLFFNLLDEKSMLTWTTGWLSFRLFSEIATVAFLALLLLRRRKPA
ncbi:hypothetical protein J31TS4_13870 [Paenibacillus sp. J31TS4]|uniref:hypothetical protein n=1 Tax=Paenibacillus sp. J31TS4 TaxID=2807195 RepID=UPI001B0BE15B|nr:hypothetical protein [Paenibacillus sp. J31TS4]GIP38107.1 hypothetical protein J31TS4_13870 [Paenibacillus sp. J31TS4]